MKNEEAKPVKLNDLSEDRDKRAEAGEVKGGAPVASQKGVLLFDEADALFGRDGVKKQTP